MGRLVSEYYKHRIYDVMFIPIDPSDSNEAMYLLSFFDNFIFNVLLALIVILFVGLCAGDSPLQGAGPPDQQASPCPVSRYVPASIITCRGPKISSAPFSWIFVYLC